MKAGVYKRAICEAENSEHPVYRIGAVIFKSSKIFSSGCNSFRSSCIPEKYRKFSHTLHAEQAAIHNAQNWEVLKGASILVIRINNSGNISRGYPCSYCYNSIKHVGIKNIFYSDRDGTIKRERV